MEDESLLKLCKIAANLPGYLSQDLKNKQKLNKQKKYKKIILLIVCGWICSQALKCSTKNNLEIKEMTCFKQKLLKGNSRYSVLYGT